jgi:hypothetical protein
LNYSGSAACSLPAHLRRTVTSSALGPFLSRIGHKHLPATSRLLKPPFICVLVRPASVAGSRLLRYQASASLVKAAKSHGFELENPESFIGVWTRRVAPIHCQGEPIRILGIRLITTPFAFHSLCSNNSNQFGAHIDHATWTMVLWDVSCLDNDSSIAQGGGSVIGTFPS